MATERAAAGLAAGQQQAAGITRRRLLQAASVGAAGAALPVVGDGRVDAAGNQLPKYLRNGRFGIGMYWTPSAETTVQSYADIADCGFNLLTFTQGEDGLEVDGRVLDLAQQFKLRCIATSRDVSRLASLEGATLPPRSEWAGIVSEAIAPLLSHPAVVGVRLDDQPHADLFGRQAQLVDIMRRQAPDLVPYINVFPNYATSSELHAGDYADYLQRYSQVGAPLVSFDHDPLLADGSDRGRYFANWAAVRTSAQQRGVPPWGFVQACGRGQRQTSPHALIWQMNVALAYGAKALTYGAFGTPGVSTAAPLVDLTGQRTPFAHAVRSANLNWLQPVGDELAMMRSESVVHTGLDVPEGTEPFHGDGWIDRAEGSPVVLGSFSSRLRRDRRWAMVVNQSHTRAAALTLRFAGGVHKVARFDPAEEEYKPMPGQATIGRNSLRFGLKPGTAVLLRMSTAR